MCKLEDLKLVRSLGEFAVGTTYFYNGVQPILALDVLVTKLPSGHGICFARFLHRDGRIGIMDILHIDLDLNMWATYA